MHLDDREYQSKTEIVGRTLRYTRTFEIKDLSVPVSEAEKLREFYRVIADDERNSAVLKRVVAVGLPADLERANSLSRCEASVLKGKIECLDADLWRGFTQMFAVSGLPPRGLEFVRTHMSHVSRLESRGQSLTMLLRRHIRGKYRP